MRKCYLVFGPESSGTRILTRILVEAGCLGNYTHTQLFDIKDNDDDYSTCNLPVKGNKDVVLRRSFPYGMWWPDTEKLIFNIIDQDYDPYIIVLIREKFSIIKSQIRRGMCEGNEICINNNINEAYLNILNSIILNSIDEQNDFFFVSYESLMTNINYFNNFLRTIGLRELKDNEIHNLNLRNENLKYY